MPKRSYMLATTVSQSRFCRLTTVTRSRLWHTAQRVSTSSLPGPLGSAAAVAAGGPGPHVVERGWVGERGAQGGEWAPRRPRGLRGSFLPRVAARGALVDVRGRVCGECADARL